MNTIALRMQLSTIVQELNADTQIIALTDVRNRMYDETPTQCKINSSVFDQELVIAKVLQSEMEWACLFKVITIGASFHMILIGRNPCTLQVMDHTTAECTKRCVEMQDRELYSNQGEFERKVHLATTDEFKSNQKAEYGIRMKDRKCNPTISVSGMHILCDVHKVMTVLTKQYLFTWLMSWSISLFLGTRIGGARKRFHQIVMKYVMTHLRIYHNSTPGPHADRHRNAVFDCFCSPTTRKRAKKRAILEFCTNGDLESQEIQHFESGCCENEDMTREIFKLFFVPAISTGLKLLLRSRWLGIEDVFDWIGLGTSIHGILIEVVKILAREFRVEFQSFEPLPAPALEGAVAGDPEERDFRAEQRIPDIYLDLGS